MKRNYKRLNVQIPEAIFNRLNMDSVRYGITKTAIVTNLLFEHYEQKDRAFRHMSSESWNTDDRP